MGDKKGKYKPRGKSVCPHVNRRCAGALQKVLEYDLGITEEEPEVEDYRVVASFAKNLSFEIKYYDVKREKIEMNKAEIENRYNPIQKELEEDE